MSDAVAIYGLSTHKALAEGYIRSINTELHSEGPYSKPARCQVQEYAYL